MMEIKCNSKNNSNNKSKKVNKIKNKSIEKEFIQK